MSEFDHDATLKKALRQGERRNATLDWMRQRSQAVKDSISAHDVLRYHGISLRYSGSGHEEQIQCPFHGKDNKPSARVYPDDARSKSHVFCYTCGNGKNWDVFALWRKFKGDEEMKFSQAVYGLENAFGIIPPDPPKAVASDEEEDEGPTEQEREVFDLFDQAERRLRDSRGSFEREGYLRLGQLLDKVRYRMDNRQVTPEQAEAILRQIFNKISEKKSA